MAAAPSIPHVARLGNTTFPVKLIKTCGDPKDVSFEKAGPNGGKLDQVVVSRSTPGEPLVTRLEESGRGPVEEGAELRLGIWLGDRFVDLSEQIAAIDDEETLEEMEILGFVRREQVPLHRVLGSHWMAPGDPKSAKVLRILHEVCRGAHRCPVVAWTKKANRALGVVVPEKVGALLVVELAFAENYRGVPGAALSMNTIDVTSEQVDAMTTLVAAMSEHPDLLDEVEDDRRRRRRELAEYVAEHGEAPEVSEPVEAEIEDDVLAALEAALA